MKKRLFAFVSLSQIALVVMAAMVSASIAVFSKRQKDEEHPTSDLSTPCPTQMVGVGLQGMDKSEVG